MFVVLDTETTGLNADRDEILQLAICDMDGKKLFDKHFKPELMQSWPEAQAVNGITPQSVEKCPPISQYVEEISSILANAQKIYIYNAEFDVPFLRGVGIEVDQNKVHCTMLDFAELIGEPGRNGDYKWFKLVDAYAHATNGKTFPAHDAFEDVLATAEVQKWCNQEREHSYSDNLSQ